MSTRRPWAWPLVPLYRAGLAAQEALRSTGVGRPLRLPAPVISVGSISAGGAGKTPLVIALAKLLGERGWAVDVLSRGYRRSGRGVARVDPDAPDAAHRFGDEPTLIAQRTGLPVWVGSSRYEAGLMAERSGERVRVNPVYLPLPPSAFVNGEPLDLGEFGTLEEPQADSEGERYVHLLDDGFQHRGLASSVDLVLVTAEDLRDTLLPAGNLREPFRALRRADALAVREDELPVVEAPLRALVGADIPFWTVRRTLRFPGPLGIFGAGLRPLAFCALARPEGFATMLGKAGCGVVDTVIFDDHHRYDDRDITEVIALAKKLRATGLVTTEKDAVKLQPAMLTRLSAEVGPVMVVALDAAFVFESPVMRLLTERVRAGAADAEVVSAVRSH